MNNAQMEQLLRQELRIVAAPDGMWTRVEGALLASRMYGAPRAAILRFAWVYGGGVVLALALWGVWTQQSRPELNVDSYVPSSVIDAPAGSASVVTSGYTVAERHVVHAGNEPVRQFVLNAAGNMMALFVASPRVRFERPNSARLRTAVFPCSREVCVLVCKTCSSEAFRTLLGRVASGSAQFQ